MYIPPLTLSTYLSSHLSQFHQLTESDACRDRIRDLSEKFAGKKILLGVDRVDYIKGMYVEDERREREREREMAGRVVCCARNTMCGMLYGNTV